MVKNPKIKPSTLIYQQDIPFCFSYEILIFWPLNPHENHPIFAMSVRSKPAHPAAV
jgi:hypothetical protein